MNNKIHKNLVPFLQNDKPEFAIMINGKWGSGKTFYLKYELESEFNSKENGKDIKVLHVSANGVKTFDEIINRLKWEKFGFRGAKIAASLANAALPLIPYEKVAKSLGPLANTTFDQIIGFKSTDVIVIDDLERVNRECDLIGLLGKINTEFIEGKHIKVILVCAQDEIKYRFGYTNETSNFKTSSISINYDSPSSLDSDTNHEEDVSPERSLCGSLQDYYNIKEKIVDQTLEFVPNLPVVLPKLIEKYVTSDRLIAHLSINENYNEVLSNIQSGGTNNLRKISKFLKVASVVVEEVSKEKDDYALNTLLFHCLNICRNSDQEGEKSTDFISRSLRGLDSVYDYVLNGELDRELLNREYNKILEEAKMYSDEKKELSKLVTLRSTDRNLLTQDEFENVLNNCITYIGEGRFNIDRLMKFADRMAYYINTQVINRYNHSDIAKLVNDSLEISKEVPLNVYNLDLTTPEHNTRHLVDLHYKDLVPKLIDTFNFKKSEYYNSLYRYSIETLINKHEFDGENALHNLLLNLDYKKLHPIVHIYCSDITFMEKMNEEMTKIHLFYEHKPYQNLRTLRSDIQKELGNVEGPKRFLFNRFNKSVDEILQTESRVDSKEIVVQKPDFILE